ncbi:SDR family oxidoreductase [Amycolatopsis minnesotensis]|uniref:SDR family oxidoreductase n=1 Tax=Amycolatopsis minnesotensis TaxID=337894 RepID=A0ABN2QHI9_9PSEU
MHAKNAIVTGASKGIGLAVVEALVADGYRVVAGARTVPEELTALTPLAIPVDLTTAEGNERLVEYAEAELGGIDLLVNNVGGTALADGFLSATDEDWAHTLDLTLMSTVRATRAALPGLIERRGSVVNIGSVNSRLAVPHLVAYSAAKAALASLGKSLAEEFGARGVRVNTISPGPVRTTVWTEPGSNGEELARRAGLTLAEFVDRIPELTGLSTGDMTEPSEVAALVVFLASRQAPNISGSDFVIDGGMLKEI